MGVAALEGNIHVFGGRQNDYTDMLDRHDVYDPSSSTWSTAASLPRPRSAGAFAVFDGHIVYAGGECKPGGAPFTANTFEDVDAYDAMTDSWSPLIPLPEGRHAFGERLLTASPISLAGHSSAAVAQAPICWPSRWKVAESMAEEFISARQRIGDFAPKLATLTDDVLFADVWERPGLSKRDRSLVTVAALIALYRTNEMAAHMKRLSIMG